MVHLILFIAQVFTKVLYVYSFILVAYALLSWFPGAYQTKLGQFIIRLADPYVTVFRRLNLHIGMVDFSVMAAILSLQAIEYFGLKFLGLLLTLFV
ncbi:YggT family protein [Streptococcus rupicaprae]|uniref:YggT family protein n=2 Tax=Streptococcus TaxID=1301 RepID=A0A7X6S1H0_9STRE|nr:YggT family protein [Streptococcus ovuberis]NKZ20345.1 YggT family protein [Streptococcus ovuberis]